MEKQELLKKTLSALEIAEKLNVPTVYVEEELDILVKGKTENMGFCADWTTGSTQIVK